MIDFKSSGVFLRLKKVKETPHSVEPLLLPDEEVIGTYQGLRDFVTFTSKRIIAVNVQGLTGKKKDFTSLPYSKVQAFSVETAGVFDLDSELELYFSSLGKVKFDFHGASDIVAIGKTIGKYVL